MLLSAGTQLAGWKARQKDEEGYRNVSDQGVGTYIIASFLPSAVTNRLDTVF